MPTMRLRFFVSNCVVLILAGQCWQPAGFRGRAAAGQSGGPGVSGLERLVVELPAGVPAKVGPVLSHVDQNGEAPPGYVGGRAFTNDGRRGEVVLPRVDADGNPIDYREWDVNLKRPGVNRGPERLVTGSDGSAYYSADHYQTFVAIRGAPSAAADPARALAGRESGLPEVVRLSAAEAAKVDSVLAQVRVQGRTIPGYAGGADYSDDGQGVGQVLPRVDADFRAIRYQEWDVDPRVPGSVRGPERLVTGSDGSAYYSNDLFRTFRRIR